MKINEFIAESEQLDELSWKDVQKGAKKVAKGAEKFTKNVNATGDALGGAASAIGGAAKAVGNQFVAKPVAGAYNAVKGGIRGAANVAKNVYGDAKQGVTAVGNAVDTVQQDTGNAAKSVGRNVAGAVGGAAGAVGAVAGGATTGVGRAAATGFNAGAQAVGGDEVDRLGSVFKQAPAAAADAQPQQQTGGADVTAIKQQIAQKQTELKGLQQQLATASAEPAEEPAAQDNASPVGDKLRAAGQDAAAGINSLSAAIQRGQGMGTAGQSLAQTSTSKGTDVSIKDATGKDHKFKKVGDRWFDENNTQADPATAAMLNKQAAPAPTTAPAAQEPISIGGQKLDPSKPADAKIIAQVQQQAAAPASANIANDVQARMAKQLGTVKQNGINTGVTAAPSASAPAQNFKQQPAGSYGATTMNAPTATLPATNVMPKLAPKKAAPAAAAPTVQTAGFDHSAALLRKMKTAL